MSTATIERDQLVSQPAREVVYAARREDLRLVHTPQYPRFGPQGQKIGMNTPGVVIAFHGGNLRIPLTGEVETENGGKFDAAELNEWLQSHKLFDDPYEGFIRLEASAPPPSAQEMKALIRLGQAFDREGLEDFIEQERAGWNRSELIESAQESLAGITRLEEEAQQRAAKPAKPAKGAQG